MYDYNQNRKPSVQDEGPRILTLLVPEIYTFTTAHNVQYCKHCQKTHLRCIYVGDIETARDETADTKQSDGQKHRVTAAYLCQEKEYTGTEEIQTQRPLSAEPVDSQQVEWYY